MHTDLIELGTHQVVAGHGGEVIPVHDLGDVMTSNRAPVGDAGSTVLIAARVSAVGIALGVSDKNGDIAVKDILVHQHRITPLGGT